jgi:hypothetical protein
VLYEHYIGHCLLTEVFHIGYTTFRELALLPFLGDRSIITVVTTDTKYIYQYNDNHSPEDGNRDNSQNVVYVYQI